MNKNKKVVKAMSSVLCASMLMGSVTPVFAATTDTQTTSNETDTKKVEVTYNKSASYQVTIPKVITLDSNKTSKYCVKVSGDIPSDKEVYVSPLDAISSTNEIDFYMKDQSTKNAKEDVVATVTHNKDTWDFEDVANGVEETNNTINATNLTAGNWKGTFNFNINLKDVGYGEDVTLTSSNLETYGIADTGDVTIPSVVVDSEGVKHKVTSIGDSVFRDCESLTSITIPNSVTSIGDYAFRGCSGLTSLTIPDSVTSIGNGAFQGCTKLTSITIPNSVTSIETNAFAYCTKLTSIEIPDSVTSIGSGVFYGCSGLTSIKIPNSVTSIKEYAFYNCTKLTSIEIPDSVTSIGGSAFYHCSALTSITIPNSVTSIGGSAFYHCSALTSIAIPNSVTSIGESVFEGCNGLTSIEIPDSVTSIGGYAFYNCSGLTSITIPNSVTSIGDNAFYNCSGLSSITYKGVNYTSKAELTNALASNGVSIGSNVFYKTKLQ